MPQQRYVVTGIASGKTEGMIQRGIRINSISPGAVDTSIPDDFAQAYGAPMKRNLPPERQRNSKTCL